jgi:hypothetical protein
MVDEARMYSGSGRSPVAQMRSPSSSGSSEGSLRRYIYISILAIDPTYFINAYGQNPTSQKSVTIMGLPWVPELVRISNRVFGVGG